MKGKGKLLFPSAVACFTRLLVGALAGRCWIGAVVCFLRRLVLLFVVVAGEKGREKAEGHLAGAAGFVSSPEEKIGKEEKGGASDWREEEKRMKLFFRVSSL
ncbi:hypothetical protein KY284_012940 [Solanum tuberosum]|nr:hypothetical protein KY284_012940 [Solanum tuberosum]